MRVYLLRHALPNPDFPDSNDGLGVEGRDRATAVARFLANSGQFLPDEIWHSPLPRSRTTAEIIKKVVGGDFTLVEREDMLPQSVTDSCFRDLCETVRSVAVVGHLPQLKTLFFRMQGRSDQECWEIAKNGVCCMNGMDYVDSNGIGTRTWSLFYMISPGMIYDSGFL